jgi:hypothetical protein
MPTFPKLKTGAVAEYPSTRSIRFQNQTLRFLDGTEQRYRDSPSPLRCWEILLDQLDDSELAMIGQFFAECEGAFADFTFTDPWDGREYRNCSLDSDALETTALAEMHGQTRLLVVENR